MNTIYLSLFVLLFLFTIETSAQKYNAEIVKYSTYCDVKDNKIVQIDSVIIQINNTAGEAYTEIAIPYSKMEKVSDLEAWIENSEGIKIRSLKKSEIADRSAFSGMYLFQDNFLKTFQLRHNIYPYRVAYTFKTTINEYFSIAAWSPVVHMEIPTREAVLRVKLPREYEYNQYVRNIGKAKPDTTEKEIALQWKGSYNNPLKQEVYSNPKKELPLVVVAPVSFKYGIEGSLKNWETYGNWQYRLLKGLDALPDKEKKTIDDLVKGITDKKEIIKRLYHYLQDQTHYVNVSIGVGGMKPYPASYVSQTKYGDCKALSNYMKALLSYAGIESFYANVNLSAHLPDMIREFPGPQFNHAILAVPLDKDTIWLDNTANTRPIGYIGTSLQNREALLICENNSRLVKIPAMKKEENHSSFVMEYFLNKSATSKIKITSNLNGADFEGYNSLNSNYNENVKDKYIREYMAFENYEVIDWKLNKINRDTASIRLEVTMNLYKFLKSIGNEFYFNVYPLRLTSLTPPGERTLPVTLPYPESVSETMIYHLPSGYTLKTLPEPITLISRFGIYKSETIKMNDNVKVLKSFELNPGEYPLKEYPEFYSFIQSVKEKDDIRLILKPDY